ncbi:MAG: hypothetical protein ACXVJT_11805 [Thermoanaerobaculia bacterium]
MRRYTGPVLPRISGKATPDGMLLTRAGVTAKDLREQLLLGAAFLIGAVAVLLGARARRFDDRPITYTISMYFLLCAGVHQYLVRRRLRRAALLVRPWPIRLGDDIEVKFRATFRSSTAIAAVTAKLECVEEVTIGSGRDQRKEHATLFAIDLPCVARPAGDRKFTESWTATVPDALPPSLTVRSNAVHWQVSTLVTTDGVDVPASFELLVLPEVARD